MTLPSALRPGAVLVAALSCSMAPSIDTLASHPKPATSYAAAVARAARVQAVDDSVAVPAGRTLLLTHGHATARVFVLLHGLTNSPHQFLPMAQEIFALGDNVYVPRLPDHAERGGTARTLSGLTAESLRDCADDAVDIAAGLGDTIIVVGLSAGGTMAAWIAQFRPEVRRVVLIAPALAPGELPMVIETPLEDIAVRAPSVTRRAAPDTAHPDREPGVNTGAVAQLFRLGIAARAAAANTAGATRQATFLLNAHDRTVKNAVAIDLAHDWTAHGMPVVIYELPDSLRLPHDVVDAAVRAGRPEIVRPILMHLAYGKTPPRWVHTLAPRAAPDR